MNKQRAQSGYKLTEGEIKIIDELPSSAVELQVKDKVSARLIVFFTFFLCFCGRGFFL